MSNPKYVKGRAREYAIMKNYKRRGWIVLRSAGSHSPFDVVAVNKALKQVTFIQSKAGVFSKANRDILMKEYDWLNNEFLCKFMLLTDEDYRSPAN